MTQTVESESRMRLKGRVEALLLKEVGTSSCWSRAYCFGMSRPDNCIGPYGRVVISISHHDFHQRIHQELCKVPPTALLLIVLYMPYIQ